MSSPEFLQTVKDSLRITGTDLNIEIQDLIEAGQADLILSGVLESKIIETDPLIKRAIIVYCKANFGYEDPKYADRFQESYISLKHHLTLSAEYTTEGDLSG